MCDQRMDIEEGGYVECEYMRRKFKGGEMGVTGISRRGDICVIRVLR